MEHVESDANLDGDDDNTCIVCCDAPVSMRFCCGHATLCISCVGQLSKKVCPICRAEISHERLNLQIISHHMHVLYMIRDNPIIKQFADCYNSYGTLPCGPWDHIPPENLHPSMRILLYGS